MSRRSGSSSRFRWTHGSERCPKANWQDRPDGGAGLSPGTACAGRAQFGLDPVVRRSCWRPWCALKPGKVTLSCSPLICWMRCAGLHHVAMMANGALFCGTACKGCWPPSLSHHPPFGLKESRNLPGVIAANPGMDGEWRVICQGTQAGFLDALRATGGKVISESDPRWRISSMHT